MGLESLKWEMNRDELEAVQQLDALLDTLMNTSTLVCEILKGTAAPLPARQEFFLLARPTVSKSEDNVNVVDFFVNVGIALKKVAYESARIIQKMNLWGETFPSAVTLQNNVNDYEAVLAKYREIEQSLLQMLALNRFNRLSVEERDDLIRNYLDGKSNKVLVRTFEHHVSRFDTVASIASRYGFDDWKILCDFNNLLPTEVFEGQVLKIPVKLSPVEAQQIIGTIPVFDSQIGKNAYGRDFPNEMEVDLVEGGMDLKVLGNDDTLAQGLSNILKTAPGEHPLDDSFGFSGIDSDNIPTILRDTWISMRAEQALTQDERVASARITRTATENEDVELDVVVIPKFNSSLSSVRLR